MIFNGQQFLAVQPSASISIPSDLVATTTNADLFKPLGGVVLNGSGTASNPQLLEVMGQDLGNVVGGLQS